MTGNGFFSPQDKYVSLYRRYRPLRFGEVVGQDAAISVLRHAIEGGKTVHAYLFSGPRGCGKTSLARILAKALNCTDIRPGAEPCGECPSCVAITASGSLDVVEIDGASNRGIDEIRELKAHVSLAPFSSRKKVYIVDEVHMLTEPAFNALLKTLEEPPPHAVFILATTEPQKVPVTIRSRCQHIPFRRISGREIARRLAEVCSREGIPSEDNALWELARQADGAMRDALSLLEQAVPIGGGSVTTETVQTLVGGGSRAEMEAFVSAYRSNPEGAIGKLMDSLHKGASMERLLESLFVIFRDLWILGTWGEKTLESLELSKEEKDFLLKESMYWPVENLRFCLENQAKMLGRLRYGIRADVFAGLLLQGLSIANPLYGKDPGRMPPLKQLSPNLEPRVQAAVPSASSRGSAGIFTGPEPEQRKPETSVPETIEPDRVRSFWNRLLDSRDPEGRLAAAALSGASVLSAANGITVRFEERDRLGFEMVRLEKNLRRFASLKERDLGPIPVTFCCGAECVSAEGAAVSDASPFTGMPNVPPWEKRKSALERGGNGKQDQVPGDEGAPAGAGPARSPLEEMMGWFGGEVLLVREEGDANPAGDFEDGGVTD